MRPMPRPPDRTDTDQHPSQPFGRYVCACGTELRIETDGKGGLVEYEGRTKRVHWRTRACEEEVELRPMRRGKIGRLV